MERHAEALFDREEVEEPACGDHDRHHRVGAGDEVARFGTGRETRAIVRLEPLGHAVVEGADVLALELDDVDVDEQDLSRVGLDHLLDRDRHPLEVLGEVDGGEQLVERQLGVHQPLPVALDELLVNGVLVGKVVVDVADRKARVVGDLTQGGGAVTLGGEELQAGVEHRFDGRFRPGFLPFSCGHGTSSFATKNRTLGWDYPNACSV